MLGAIVKSGRVLDLFTPRRPEWGVSEVARALGMTKSGAHAQLSALVEIGFLRRTPTNRYRLGWRLVSLTRTLLVSAGFPRHVGQELELLVRRSGDGCLAHLAVLDSAELICLHRAVGSAYRVRRPWLPAHSTASGKLLLACRSDTYRESARGEPLASLTPNTITDHAHLADALTEIRARKVAWDIEETVRGVFSVAAPVRDPDGSVLAAVAMCGEVSTLAREKDRFELLVVGASARISRQMREQAAAARGDSSARADAPAQPTSLAA